ncbi:MAG TPA: MarP family serine protease [Candidatus Saccharimonadales bacterium]|nr:MarP family serine protease [Candidatus Saccharimonadales bacterium]
MNWLDLFILVMLAASVVRGNEVGFARQFFSTVGFISGLLVALWLEVLLLGHLNSTRQRGLATILITLGLGFGFMALGEFIGLRLKFKLRMTRALDQTDRILGGVLAGITLLAVVWLAGSVVRTLPDASLQRQINTSSVVAFLDERLPEAPNILTSLGNLISPNGFPQVFAGVEPTTISSHALPDIGVLTAGVAKDAPSIVQVVGHGCGGIVEGTGFMVARDEVATSAHVVAGVAKPFVVDTRGSHLATVVWFDPNVDLAVLRVSSLDHPALALNTTLAEDGTPAAIVGFPGGGDFTAKPGVINQTFTAVGLNIYDREQTVRQVYALQGEVEEGNSGGPLIGADGSVLGIMFAKSTTYDQVGYALTAKQASPGITAARNATKSVSTGSCAV